MKFFCPILSRPRAGGGGGGKRSLGCGRTNSYAEIFWQKDFSGQCGRPSRISPAACRVGRFDLAGEFAGSGAALELGDLFAGEIEPSAYVQGRREPSALNP